jgi:cytochrome P450
MSSDHYDLFSPRFKTDPFPTYAVLRAGQPVYPHLAPNGTTIWYITRYADVATVLKDDIHFGKDPRLSAAHREGAAQSNSRRGSVASINDNMLFSDPPNHTRLRALVSQAFTPRRIAGMAPRIEATAAALLATPRAAESMDLIADYALPLPVEVISELLGIPAADRAAVAEWSQAIISPGSRGLTYSARKRAVRAFMAYLRDLFAMRQVEPHDDLITALVQAEEAGDRLSETELFSMVALLLVTGHETTVNLIGNGALALLRHPDQLELLRDDPDLWPAAVEELLRYDGPVETSTSRWVRQTVELHGYTLRRGDLVRAVIASANRDERQVDRPDTLDITRADNRHLAFGLGSHYCLGAPLARLEGIVALRALFAGPGALRLADDSAIVAWRSGVLFRGLKALPVTWAVAG